MSKSVGKNKLEFVENKNEQFLNEEYFEEEEYFIPEEELKKLNSIEDQENVLNDQTFGGEQPIQGILSFRFSN